MLRKIELNPIEQKQIESILKRKIRSCNEAMLICKKEGNEKGMEYIRVTKRKPAIERLRDVQRGYIWE